MVPLLFNWPPLSTSTPGPVASKSPWLTKPPPLGFTTVLLVVGEMMNALLPLALITPADWLINSIEWRYSPSLIPICPAPEIVLLTLVSVSVPGTDPDALQMWLLRPLKMMLPPPVTIVPSEMRKSVLFAPALSEIVPVLIIVPFRKVVLLLL